MVGLGLRLMRVDRVAAYRWFYRALLVNLLFTRVFEFDVEQFLATVSVLIDVVLLGLVIIALSVRGPSAASPSPGSTETRNR